MKVKRRFTIAGMVVGGLLTLTPFFGIFGTVFGMMSAFAALGNSGSSDPRQLASSIGVTLMSTAAGFILFPVGILIFALSIVFYCRMRVQTPPPVPLEEIR
jgi:biopolymer transport protein ExbB